MLRAAGQTNLEIEGLGWLGDRSMKERLGFLMDFETDEAAKLDAPTLEDSAFILLEQLRRQGFLRPEVEGAFASGDKTVAARWSVPYSVRLPVEFSAERAVYTIEPGQLFFYRRAEVSGLGGIDLEAPERFFIPGGSLFARKKDLAFTPENFKRRQSRLLATLEAMGHADAALRSAEALFDEKTGGVDVSVEVEPGPPHRVGSVSVVVAGEALEALEALTFETDRAFNPEWVREARARLRNAAYAAGYPEVRVEVSLVSETRRGREVLQALRFDVDPGPSARLVDVRFEGDPRTSRAVLRRQAALETGGPLDPRKTDRARRRLMALGIFRQVETDYVEEGPGERAVLYRLRPSVRRELQLLAGWGSYEQARAGFRWIHRNPWTRAHRYTLAAKQSLKATRLEALYTVPRILGSELEAYAEGDYSSRQDIGFDRSRQGILVGAASTLGLPGLRASVEYGWFAEQVEGIGTSDLAVGDDAEVASLSLNLTFDRRDNPLAPSSGYDLFGTFKTANRALGGSGDFQRIELGGSFHRPLTEQTIAHVGVRAGILLGEERDLPFGERFFPGGENSVRGYQLGEAAPLDRAGDPEGAESFWRLNLELEERLFKDLSLVGFLDTVGLSRDGGLGATTDVLSSAGLGLRYKTVVGPVRLEYGHNLDPRAGDPAGTLHVSIGYPF